MNYDSVIICGDSFGVGSGLPEEHCFEKSFGGLLAASLNVPAIFLARSGCSNYVIFLQIKHITEGKLQHQTLNPLILITTTHYSRTEWWTDSKLNDTAPTLENVEYDKYTPYHNFSVPQRKLPFATNNKFKAETMSNLALKLEDKNYAKQDKVRIGDLADESYDKVQQIIKYASKIQCWPVKDDYDEGLITLGHRILLVNRYTHVIMKNEIKYNTINQQNFLSTDWGMISKKNPDNNKTGHCNEKGHEIVFDNIKNHLELHNLL